MRRLLANTEEMLDGEEVLDLLGCVCLGGRASP